MAKSEAGISDVSLLVDLLGGFSGELNDKARGAVSLGFGLGGLGSVTLLGLLAPKRLALGPGGLSWKTKILG